jgi:hypothetical protein
VRPPVEVADIFHRHGTAWRAEHAGHVSLAQLKVMSAIETCIQRAAAERTIDGLWETVASALERFSPQKCQIWPRLATTQLDRKLL